MKKIAQKSKNVKIGTKKELCIIKSCTIVWRDILLAPHSIPVSKVKKANTLRASLSTDGRRYMCDLRCPTIGAVTGFARNSQPRAI
jgi:hypothetical protein